MVQVGDVGLPACRGSLPYEKNEGGKIHTLGAVRGLGGHGGVVWVRVRVRRAVTDERGREPVVWPVAVTGARGEGGRRRAGGRRAEVVDEDEHLRVLLGRAGARAGVALDHALRREEGLYFFAQLRDAVVLLWRGREVWRQNKSVGERCPCVRGPGGGDSLASSLAASRQSRDTAV